GVAAVEPRVNSASAKRLYLSGLNSWNDRSKDGLDSAVIDFRRAIEIDPLYADAYAGLANAYVMIGYSGYRPAKAMFPKAKAAALQSIQLDSGRAAPFAALGMELTWERKFGDAERIFQKALALDSTYATGHQWYGILLMITGRKMEAVAELKRAAELDPLSLQIQNNYATFLGAVGQREAQLQHYENAVAQEPDSAWVRRNPWLLTNLAGAYIRANQLGKAKRAAERAVEILPGHPRAVGSLAAVYRKMGDVNRARELYATADTTNEHYAAYRGFWYLDENKIDSAFISFSKVKEWGIPIMIGIANLPPAIKRDPRYAELMERLGIPTQALSTHP
ncbi:MAG: tetratricopeptide repeat protein, partial [Gemmatimonadaceae bacterium]|nr:tetratricopeptide repeat protein [Gemmatimonadaceae bacterium]